MTVTERTREGEKALLIQPYPVGAQDPALIEEFTELARSAGAVVVATITARIERPNSSTYIGSGKVEEVLAACDAVDADVVLFNHTLSPGQERNLAKALGRRVVDRTGLILDIFAQRAASHEGKLQVELAQLKHLSARLIQGSAARLDSQRGGSIGLRGPGETHLETDRRLLQKRRDQLEARLDKVEVQRVQMRRARVRNAIPRVALVGYTNAGKSTLFNALTGSEVYAADKLFATLDPTVRRMEGPGSSLVLSDTVGFVRDLPHELVAAFRSTLSEAREADLLLHVVDAADELRDERIRQVDEVLEEIGAGEIPQILVYNKIDRIEDSQPRHDPLATGRERVWLSARSGAGLDLLKAALKARFSDRRLLAELRLSADQGRLRSRLHALGAITDESMDEHGWLLQIDMPLATAERLATEAGGHLLAPLLVTPIAPTYNLDND
ncbi:MAG TPA: ribosome rescue GTPase HflX [Arenimonas sp.]|uniref:ribosome rescue GTPase HflX n=1 Tax=Arenimonas sp. TaxID=1872635 RepID=UPI002CD22E33|nr:ribosome rescue GTPase HflX [Arenimonas sp.]HMB57157.1 ribosome rescue GTPase HflX [Arenimonas sp.]